MSISSPQTGGSRRPSAKPAAGAKPAGKSTAKPAASAANKGGGRPPITPVKVSQGTPWGPIALFTLVGLLAVGIIGFGVWQVFKPVQGWEDKANAIPGIVNFKKTEPDYLKAAQHQYGPITYKQSPPVGGPHNPNWQRCQGDVYPAAIANEHAVHAMEHGAVWITYRPDLPKADVDKLAAKVKGNDYMLMSPYPGLDKPISLQAWGYQLKLDKADAKVKGNDYMLMSPYPGLDKPISLQAWGYQLKLDKADDPRIDQFIQALRINANQEGSGVVCSAGNYINTTGTTPHDLGKDPSPAAS
jgi:hypothetical protein